jgi:molybdate transport system substrate-binding protein
MWAIGWKGKLAAALLNATAWYCAGGSHVGRPQDVLKSVANGVNEIGFGLTSDTELVSGVELVGELPGEIQSRTVYAAGIVVPTSQADAAKAFVGFLSSAATQTVLKSKGFEPR